MTKNKRTVPRYKDATHLQKIRLRVICAGGAKLEGRRTGVRKSKERERLEVLSNKICRLGSLKDRAG